MSPLPTATLYKPTPLERAYASHLLATHFSIHFIPPSSTDNNNNNNNNTNNNEEDKIRLQGKLLVPFLTTSNIHRSTLRLLWNIVDPTNIGTLLSRTQFYVLLRIIAMIQGHFLPPFDDTTTSMSDEEKMKLILNALDSNSHLVIALPTFDAVDCPSVAYLLGTYPSPSVVDDTTNVDYSNFGVGGGNNVVAGHQKQMSISDAFGSLGEVEDLPLAPLEFNTPVLGDDDRNTLDEGDIEEEEPPPAAAGIVQPQLEEEGGGDEDDDEFGNFDSVQEEGEGQLPMPLNVEQSNVNDIEDEDSFGEFDHVEEEEGFTPLDGAANNAVTNQIDDDIKTDSSAEEVLEKEEEEEVQDESFGTFGDFNSVAETSQGFVDNNIIEEDVSSALEGNAQTPPFENGSVLGNSEPTMSVSDAFGSLVEQQQHDDEAADTQSSPATELNDGSTDESFGDLNEAGLDEDEKTNDDDDDDEFDTSFGDEEKVEFDLFPNNDSNSAERDENDTSDENKLSVFDSLVEIQDAPLPSLGAFSSPLGSADNMPEQSQPDESVKIESEPEENIMPDGEAEAHISSPTSEHTGSEKVGFTSDVDEFGTIEDSMGTNTISSGLGDAHNAEDENKLQLSVFDSLAGVEDKPLPPLSSFNSANSGLEDLVPSEDSPQDDEFGDFEETNITDDTAPNTNFASSEDNLTSPFDMINQDHDVPLPSLDTFAPTTHIGNEPAKDPDENKDDSNPSPSILETQDVSTVIVVESTDFCAFQDTGESSAGQVDDNEPPKPDSNDKVIFGDFTNNTNSLPEVISKVDSFPLTAEQVGDNLFDPHDDNNVVLPSSEPVQTEPDQNNEEDASFGDFNAFTEATAQDDDEEDAQVATTEDDDFEDFEAFTSAAIDPDSHNDGFIQADSSPSVNIKEEEDSFGQFDAPTSAQNNEPGSNNDDLNFGSFEGPSNIPESTTPPENDIGADDFGNFSSFGEGDTPAVDSSEKSTLEEILQSKLGNEYVKLAIDWQRIITSTEKDLQRGNKIMEYISNSLSSKDRLYIIKSRKLREYFSSLVECVRLVRLITATIGDLLCIDKDVEVQESTLSQWNNNAIVANAIIIEYLWIEIAAKAVENDIVLPKLESVVEIRSRSGHPLDEHQANRLCQLTLQVPVKEEGTCTKSSVMWNRKRYMACAANFCANRQLVL